MENTLLGYLQVRDPPPVSVEQISHGNGFDRLSAMADGIANGVSFCFDEKFAQREFTERPFTTEADYLQRGNLPYAQIIDPTPDSPDQSSLQERAERLLDPGSGLGGQVLERRARPAGQGPELSGRPQASEFDYCPAGNYVYFSDEFARQAYNSLPDKRLDRSTGRADADRHRTGGLLPGHAVRLRLEHGGPRRSCSTRRSRSRTRCWTPAATAAPSPPRSTPAGPRASSSHPPDMDEATSAVIKLVPSDQAYGGARRPRHCSASSASPRATSAA